MKKLLAILMMVSLVGLSTAAFAQTAPIGSVCDDQNVLRLNCTLTGQTPGCAPFDFQTGLAGGECPFKEYENKAIFSVCNCPDTATNFKAGAKIGVRMTILVDKKDGLGPVSGQNGAYWATTDTLVYFGRFAQLDPDCDYVTTDSFGPGHFYKTTNVTPTGYVTPYTGSACPVPSANQATIYATDKLAGYEITVTDETQALVNWYVQIPLMRIDPNVLHNGECIYVKVEFLRQTITGICFTCPPICDATIKVACVCCGETESTSSCFFPYFTSTNAPGDNNVYWNGIAIQNTSGVAGTATLTAHEADGVGVGTFTTEEIPAGGMWIRTLENIAWEGTLSGGPVYISVTSTFPTMDGFGMMADTATGESMGYLCRKSCN